MPASESQVEANCPDVPRSTGPRAVPGPARPRFDALKHEMLAGSVTLPGEDADRVKGRYVNLHAELRPNGELGELLVDRIAFESIRLGRCELFDTAYYSDRVRHAKGRFDEDRAALLLDLSARLGREYGVPRKLEAMPDGVDWMLGEWDKLRDDLDRPEGVIWSLKHLEQVRDLLDVTPSKVRASRDLILSEVVRDFFGNIGKIDAPEGLDDPGKVEWARLELLKIVDTEVARLNKVRAAMDPAVLEKERNESERLALFDPSKELILARKYEAATERSLYKAIQQFREAEAAAHPPMDVESSRYKPEACDELASFETESEPEPVGAIEPPPDVDSGAPKPVASAVRTPEERRKRPNPEKLRRR